MSELTMLMAESALRGAALAGVTALLMAVVRVRDASWRSAVWSAVMMASLLMPLTSSLLPPVFLRASAEPVAATPVFLTAGAQLQAVRPGAAPIDWAAIGYVSVAAIGLLRVVAAIGWSIGLRLRSRCVAGEWRRELRESASVSVPMTVGWLRPVVILPECWGQWEARKLETVLLHESAHIARHDYLVRTMAAVHRAVYWFNPLAWWLERKLAELAEQASDDRVLSELADRIYYAELLFSFAGGARRRSGAGRAD